jgi:hypothetical protein
MSAHLAKIVLMVVMSQGFRSLGRISGPRMAGLALGLPCSTAVALVGCGLDQGIDYAVLMSGTSLIGLAGAVALPMAYVRAVTRGWRLHRAILLGVASYLIVALSVGRLLPGRGDASLAVALLAVVTACVAAGRMRVGHGAKKPSGKSLPTASTRLLSAVVPIACLLAAIGMGEAFGPEVAGLMSTFPGVTLTVLCLTHLECGPSSAIRMARALPTGNLGMVAFLATFRFVSPSLGLVWGTVLGYLATLVILALVFFHDRLSQAFVRTVFGSLSGRMGQDPAISRSWVATQPTWKSAGVSLVRGAKESRRGDWRIARFMQTSKLQGAPRPYWPRECRRFSPLLESFT